MAYRAINPYNGQLIREYPVATEDEIEETLRNADDFYHDAKNQSVLEREKILKQLVDELAGHADYYAKILTNNMGKLFSEAKQEVNKTVEFGNYYAENGRNLLRSRPYEITDNHAYVEYDSIGAVMMVEPWNFPYMQVMRVLAPNFILGNPTILKHASIVPEAAQALEDATNRANFPKGAFKNVFATYDQVNQIIADPRVQGVALTGSERAGIQIASEAGKNLKKSTLELGGTDVFIVSSDADLDKAITDAAVGRLTNAGQACTSAKRIIVDESIYDDFLQGLSKEFSKRKLGNPLDKDTTLAPMSSKKAQVTLQKQVDEAIKGGSKLLWGENIPIEGNSSLFNPLIISGMEYDNPMYDHELFGPVAQLYVSKSDAQAVQIANNSNYGLGGAVYSEDIEKAQKIANNIETGMVAINQVMTSHAAVPFGGIKRSGYGRELSDVGIKTFANQKTILY